MDRVSGSHMMRRMLVIFIAINAALYAALVALYPLEQGLLKPRMMWAQQNGGLVILCVAHVVIYVALFAAYSMALRFISANGMEALADLPVSAEAFIPLALVIVGWLLFSVILLFAFPGESADIFDYAFRGRMLSEYGLSPLVHRPVEISTVPFHRYVSWTEWVDAYGPIWEYASAAVSAVVKLTATPAELLVHINQTCDVQAALCTLLTKYVTGYRLLATALTGVCGWLVWQIIKRKTSNTSLAAIAMLAWLWNPLVLVSTAVGAHNDALMLMFVLLAGWLIQRELWLFALLAIFAAAHVKFTALVMLPMLCLWMVHQVGWRRAAVLTISAIAVALPVSFALYASLGGWGTLPRNLFERSLISTNSIGELLYRYLRESAGVVRPRAQQIASRMAQAMFALLAALILLLSWRRKANPKGLEDPGTEQEVVTRTSDQQIVVCVAREKVIEIAAEHFDEVEDGCGSLGLIVTQVDRHSRVIASII